MAWAERIADKDGALGSVVSAMGGAACFPVIASLGAAIGLGFLSQLIVLLALYPFFGRPWTAQLLYVGLATMVSVAIWDRSRRAGASPLRA